MKRTQIAWALYAGIFAPALGIFLHSFLGLAYQHNALAPKWIPVTSWVFLILQWPRLLLDRFHVRLATSFYDSHFSGSLFWRALSEYFIVNFIGWTIMVYLILHVAFWLLSRLASGTRLERSPEGPEL